MKPDTMILKKKKPDTMTIENHNSHDSVNKSTNEQ